MRRALIAAFLLAVLVVPPAQAQDLSSVDVRMTRWRLYSSCVDEWCITSAPAADFGLEVVNRSGSSIRALRGTLHLYDALNTELGNVSVTFSGLPANTTPVVRQFSVWVTNPALQVDYVYWNFEARDILWTNGTRVTQ